MNKRMRKKATKKSNKKQIVLAVLNASMLMAPALAPVLAPSVLVAAAEETTTNTVAYEGIVNAITKEPYNVEVQQLTDKTPAVTGFNLAVYDATTNTTVYKRYESQMNMSLIVQEYKTSPQNFLTAEQFKAKHQLQDNDTLYLLTKQDIEAATLPTELRFPNLHHREHIVYDPATQQYYYFLAADTIKTKLSYRIGLTDSNDFTANYNGVSIIKSDKLDPNLLISHTADKPTKHGLHNIGNIYDIEFETPPNFADWEELDENKNYKFNYGVNKTVKWRYVQKNETGEVIFREKDWRTTTVHIGYNARENNEVNIAANNEQGYVKADNVISKQPYVDYEYIGRDGKEIAKVVYNDFSNFVVNGMNFSKLPEPIRKELFDSELSVPGTRGKTPVDGEAAFDPTYKAGYNDYKYETIGNGYEVVDYDGYGTYPNRPEKYNPGAYDIKLDPNQTFPEHIYDDRVYPFTEDIFRTGKIEVDKTGNVTFIENYHTINAKQHSLGNSNGEYALFGRVSDMIKEASGYWEYVIDTVPRTEIALEDVKLNLTAITANVKDTTGSVYADYIALDENGAITTTKLQDTKTIEDKQPKDTPYDLSGDVKKPTTLTDKDGKEYRFVYSDLKINDVAATYSDTGKVVKGKINATHYYAPVQEKIVEEDLTATLRLEYYDAVTKKPFPGMENGFVYKSGVVGKIQYKQKYYKDKNNQTVEVSKEKIGNVIKQGVPYDLVDPNVTENIERSPIQSVLEWNGTRTIIDPATSEEVSTESPYLNLLHEKTEFVNVHSLNGEFYTDSVVKFYYDSKEVYESENGRETRDSKDHGTLIIHYVDEEGNKIAPSYTHTDNAVVGTATYEVAVIDEYDPADPEALDPIRKYPVENVRYNETYTPNDVLYNVETDVKTGTDELVKPQTIREYVFTRSEAKIPLSGNVPRGTNEITLVYKKPYQVTHRFTKAESVPTHIALPEDIATRTNGKDYAGVFSGESRVPNSSINRTAYVDNVNNGTWTFEKWDKQTVTVGADNPNPEFVGTWLFTPNETPDPVLYEVTHRFEKASTVPDNITLPTEISGRITADKNYTKVPSGESRTPNNQIDVTEYPDTKNNGVWRFVGWDSQTTTVNENNPNPVFIGYWDFIPNPAQGSVKIRYKALNETGTDIDNSVTLRNDYEDTPLTTVGTQYNAEEVKENDFKEKPLTFDNVNNKNYTFVRVEKTVNGVAAEDTNTSGNVVEGETVITYVYAPVQKETATTENKGSVVIEYRRLGDKKEIASAKDDRKDVVVSTTTNTKTFYVVDGQRTYLDGGEKGVDTTVATPADQLAYNANQAGEQPPTISFQDTDAGETAEKTYHFVKHDEDSADITGSVEAGKTKKVVYLYSPEQTETIPKDNTAKVTVNYYKLGTNEPLQPSYEDTPATKISETVTTNTYYLNANDERVPVGNPAVVTNPVDPAVTYDTTKTKNGKEERPTTLESDSETYHLVETATTFTDGTGIRGNLTKDTVVNYYYAKVEEEEVSRTPITGKVHVHYKRASDKQELKGTYTDTPDTTVAYEVTKRSYYKDAQGVKHQVGESRTSREEVSPVPTYTVEGTAEVPSTLPYENTTYHYIGLETGSKPLKGNVVEGTTEVTLLYTPELSETKTTPTHGSVVVRYKLEGSETDTTPDGFTLRDDYPDTTNVVVKNQTTTRYYYLDANTDKQTVREVTADPVPTNERYEITEAEAPEILVSKGKQYRKVRRSDVPESGLVPEDTTTITYYYAPIQGGVIVKYVNEAGAEIADDYTDTALTTQLTDPVQSYNAEGKKADGQTDEKPSELVGKDRKTYVFKEVKTGEGLSQPTGNLKEGTTTVVYVYKEKDKGSVLVRYKALKEDGQTVDDTVRLADNYQDTPETYIGKEWNTTGNKADGSLEKPADFRNVNGKDYLLVEEKTTTTHDDQPVDNNPTSGQVQKGQTVVTYYYAPVPQGSVRIEYKALHPNGDVNTDLNLRKVYFDTLNANVGTDYNASETKRVDHDDNPATPLEDEKPGQIVLGATTYRLVEARTTKRLNDGQDSLTTLTSGKVEKGTTTITYYYAPVLGDVIVKYKALNADGTAVDTSIHLTDDYPEVTAGNVNEAYAITGQKPNSQEDEKPSTFVKAGKTYHLIASKTTKQVGTDPEAIVGDNHDGNVAEGTTLITFFYAPEQVEKGSSREVKGDVNIRYEDTAGKEIKTSLPDTVQRLVATYTRPDRRYIKVDNQVRYLDEQGAETEVLSNLTYDATQVREGNVEEKPSIITHNGKKYHFIKLKNDSASETGTVTAGTKTVTYVYALEQTDVQEADITGSVVVKYQKLEDKSPIKNDYNDTTNIKVGVKRTSQNYYVDKDGVRQLVGNPTETKELLNPAPIYTVEGDTEKPAIIDVKGINYHFVGIDETKSALTGDVIEGTKEVVLLYNPELVERTPNTRKASVYVDYKILGTNEELQARYTDTDQKTIATSETTKRYHLNKDGSEKVLETTTSPETLVNVSYDTTQGNERPTTLTKAGKEYHLVIDETVGETTGTLTGDV
ncbi:TPA: SHIRT domain-containing protein, partial [Streptococcus suis]